MYYIFLGCAVFGGTILVVQFLLTMFGLGFDDGGGATEIGDIDTGGAADLGDVDLPDVDGDADFDGGGGGHHHQHHSDGQQHNTALGILKYLTFQTIVAFFAFFGLGGLIGLESTDSSISAFLVGLAAGTAALFGFGHLFRSIQKFETDGTFRIARAVGAPGRVYLRVPGGGSGLGKVTVTVQGRSVELDARTSGAELKTGSECVVSRVLDSHTVEVAAPAAVSNQV